MSDKTPINSKQTCTVFRASLLFDFILRIVVFYKVCVPQKMQR
jgi:hypothetical protein